MILILLILQTFAKGHVMIKYVSEDITIFMAIKQLSNQINKLIMYIYHTVFVLFFLFSSKASGSRLDILNLSTTLAVD
jgi:hypothetical protein